MNFERQSHGSVFASGKLYVFGGISAAKMEDEEQEPRYCSIEVLDLDDSDIRW